MSSYQPAAPFEDINRGTVVALLAIPVGIAVFVFVWNLNIVASIISLGVGYLAMFLYRLGSGGGMSRAGSVRVAIITLVTLALSIFGGVVSEVAIGVGGISKTSPFEALLEPGFWGVFQDVVAQADGSLWRSIGLAAVFGLLGCFSIIRSAFGAQAGPAAQAAPAEQYTAPGQAFAGPGAQPHPYHDGFQGQVQQYPSQATHDEAFPAQTLGEPIPGIPQFPSQVQQPTDAQPQPGVQYPNPPGHEQTDPTAPRS